MQYQKIIVKNPNEVVWPFTGSPHYKQKMVVSSWDRSINIDPFPCIVPNAEIITKKIEDVESTFPIGAPVQYVILPHEILERCNAWAQRDYIYSDGSINEDYIQKKHRIEALVVFSGKRSNIHPAMSRFLVAHEYGHCVDYWISSIMKEENGTKDDDFFRKAYAEVRGVQWNDCGSYGGGRYHDDIAEIIADDFRIVIAETDVDFYQHSCGNPLENQLVVDYWRELREKYGFDKWWSEPVSEEK